MAGYDNEAAKVSSSEQGVVVNGSTNLFADPSALQNRIDNKLSQSLLWRGVVQFACGLLTLIFGCLAMYFYSEIYQIKWPMSSGSGIWSGLFAAVGGVVTIYASKIAGEETLTKPNQKLQAWMGFFHGANLATLITSIQHTTYSGIAIGRIWMDDASLVVTVLMEVTGLILLGLAIYNMVWQHTKCRPMGLAARGCRTCR